MAARPTLTFRLSEEQRAHLEKASAAAGQAPSAYLRHLLDVDRGEASLDDLSAIATREEVLEVLTKAARRGNLRACELLLKFQPAGSGAGAGKPDGGKPRSTLDELAERRRTATAAAR